jgi:hypothetical protein
MANITLNIYDVHDKTKIKKTLEAEGYDLMLGTVEDFMDIIDIDKINDSNEVAKMAIKGYRQLKPLIMDIFPELTNEDYKRIKVSDLVRLIVQVGKAVVESLDLIKSSKN